MASISDKNDARGLYHEVMILRNELSKTRYGFLGIAAAQHNLACDCKARGDEVAMRERFALRDAYRGAARDISDTLARVTRRMKRIESDA